MDKKEYDIVEVTNVTEYDFPHIDMKQINAPVRTSRTVRERADSRVFEKPDVPTLMWDGEVYALKAGETREWPRFIAERFVKKIVDRAILDKTKLKGVTNNIGARGLRNDTLRKAIQGLVLSEKSNAPIKKVKVEEESKGEESAEVISPYDSMKRTELMTIAKEKGIKFDITVTKDQLLGLLSE
jgi:hypothetical protein